MKLHRALLGATLCAAALAAPATASQGTVNNGFVYTASTSDNSGLLNATCVVRPNRFVADYGPTDVNVVSVFTGPDIVSNDVTCSVTFLGSTDTVTAYGSSFVTKGSDRIGFVGASFKVCVSASASRTVDAQYYAPQRCTTY